MNKIHFITITIAICILLLLCNSQVKAQASRTWVSGVGDDVNPCSRTAPCKSFAGAISKTAAGGEISAINPGNFGAVTINKSITLNGDNVLTNVSVDGTNAITVAAGATDIVVIRSISINGSATNGIVWTSGGELRVENCNINGFTNTGIHANTATSGALSVKNTSITGAASTATGIKVTASAGNVTASLSDVRLQGLNVGLDVLTGGIVSIRDSIISQNQLRGILAQSGSLINTENCIVANNGIAIQANTNATVRLSNNQIVNNTTGIGSGGGIVISFLNNKIVGNGTTGTPTAYLTTY